jgi:aryl-alcohol dehydrogenase-like predicted oxidoreductase
VLASRDLERAWEYAASVGIPAIGASVSDLESAAVVCQTPGYRVMQIPYNRASAQFAPAIRSAAAAGLRVVVNRPFEMGKVCRAGADLRTRCVEAFAFVRAEPGVAVVLSGTRNAEHLRWNLECFREAGALRGSR